MGRQVVVVLYVLALVAVVVGVDVLFFRQFRFRREDAPMPVLGSGASYSLRQRDALYRSINSPLMRPRSLTVWPFDRSHSRAA